MTQKPNHIIGTTGRKKKNEIASDFIITLHNHLLDKYYDTFQVYKMEHRHESITSLVGFIISIGEIEEGSLSDDQGWLLRLLLICSVSAPIPVNHRKNEGISRRIFRLWRSVKN